MTRHFVHLADSSALNIEMIAERVQVRVYFCLAYRKDDRADGEAGNGEIPKSHLARMPERKEWARVAVLEESGVVLTEGSVYRFVLPDPLVHEA